MPLFVAYAISRFSHDMAYLFIHMVMVLKCMMKQSKDKINEPRHENLCICENRGADQLLSNCRPDQPLCFRNIDSTIPLLPKSEISSL